MRYLRKYIKCKSSEGMAASGLKLYQLIEDHQVKILKQIHMNFLQLLPFENFDQLHYVNLAIIMVEHLLGA